MRALERVLLLEHSGGLVRRGPSYGIVWIVCLFVLFVCLFVCCFEPRDGQQFDV
jgi:hypothetical protein